DRRGQGIRHADGPRHLRRAHGENWPARRWSGDDQGCRRRARRYPREGLGMSVDLSKITSLREVAGMRFNNDDSVSHWLANEDGSASFVYGDGIIKDASASSLLGCIRNGV